MRKLETYAQQLRDGIDEMEATIERLRDEIRRLQAQRDELERDIASPKKEVLYDF